MGDKSSGGNWKQLENWCPTIEKHPGKKAKFKLECRKEPAVNLSRLSVVNTLERMLHSDVLLEVR